MDEGGREGGGRSRVVHGRESARKGESKEEKAWGEGVKG